MGLRLGGALGLSSACSRLGQTVLLILPLSWPQMAAQPICRDVGLGGVPRVRRIAGFINHSFCLQCPQSRMERWSEESHPGPACLAYTGASRGCCGPGWSHRWVPVQLVFGFYSNKLRMVVSPVSSPLGEPAPLTWNMSMLGSNSPPPALGHCLDGRAAKIYSAFIPLSLFSQYLQNQAWVWSSGG